MELRISLRPSGPGFVALCRLVVTNLDRDMEFVWTLKHLNKTSWQRVSQFKSAPRNQFRNYRPGTGARPFCFLNRDGK